MKNISDWVDLLERELPLFCHGSAIAHIDGKHGGIWTAAQNEYRSYIAEGHGTALAHAYFSSCIEWVREYKADWISDNPGKEPPWLYAQEAYGIEAAQQSQAGLI